METDSFEEPARQYAESVRMEKAAWQVLQSEPPGSDARARACSEWMDAISRTNRAWRRLSSSRAGQSWNRAASPSRPHAGA
jgi:hypothetical protein